jgi:hypothetical protein
LRARGSAAEEIKPRNQSGLLSKERGLLFFAPFAIIVEQPLRTVRNHPVLKQNYGPKARCAFQAAQAVFLL